MAYGSKRLVSDAFLDLAKQCVQLDPNSPTYLAWAEHYEAKRVTPGAVAGSWDIRTKQYQVSCKANQLYVKHVVWMLHNNAPLAPNTEIAFEDDNPRNCAPANLKVISKRQANQIAYAGSLSAQRATMLHKSTLPTGFVLEEGRNNGGTISVGIVRMNRTNVRPLFTARNKMDALGAASIAAFAWGLIPTLPSIAKPLEPMLAYISAIALDHYTPGDAQERAVVRGNVLGSLKELLTRISDPVVALDDEARVANQLDNLPNLMRGGA